MTPGAGTGPAVCPASAHGPVVDAPAGGGPLAPVRHALFSGWKPGSAIELPVNGSFSSSDPRPALGKGAAAPPSCPAGSTHKATASATPHLAVTRRRRWRLAARRTQERIP
ncbi:hypothetical protein ABZ901_32765 [Actinacidiphila alni]|uniref:hypothetical protein n=1 Tax=Actinacidiphila alni TaxID=380248 RepID=UPI00340BF7E1